MNRRFIRKVMVISLLFAIAISLVACAGSLNNQNQAGNQSPRQPGSIEYPLKLKDQAGQIVTIKQEPKRIVSLIPSATEIAFALKLDDKVKAVTSNDDYPSQVKKLPKVGDMKINPEKVLEQAPDLVLASSLIGKDVLDQLKKRGLTVLVVDANNIRQVYQSIDLIGDATNHTRQADQLIASMEKRKLTLFRQLAAIPTAKRVKVWLEMGPELFSVGGDTLQNELIQVAGGNNVAAKEKGWPQISAEKVISWNPDVIVSSYGGEDKIIQRSGWNTVHAIQTKHVFVIDPNLISRPGPRIIDGMEKLAQLFYPDQVGTK
ncbi:iron complex transport system substrate-binding protein [Seinonella peptonophila]|uniref:Iron complex transport system substrate-binding protein n=1 Tax=Seinonella peptonophila TaxID=112248 RepID=A0A1M5AIL1_9BACL|nr:cobalamin-binding protein [Seinonella peptonophila]SHF29974.1 iron complex transport system substrate-binding protein [Seinonella peptonophila]